MKKNHLIFILLIFIFSSCENEGDVGTVEVELPLVSKPVQDEVVQEYFVAPKIPKEMVFAGETISFQDLDVKERLDRELNINNFWHSRTILSMKRANRWFPMMRKIFQEENIPEDLIYIAVIESGLMNVASYKGAQGFWQIMERTGKELGLIIDNRMDERYNVEKSTKAACDYMNTAYKKLGSWVLVAAAYNRGVRAMEDNLKRQKVTSYFDLSLGEETSRYVFRVLAIKLIYENPKRYGFYLTPDDLYPPYETKDVVVGSSIDNLYEWSVKQGITIKILRKLNPWIKGNRFKVLRGETFIFKIPKNNEQLGVIEG